MKEDESVKNPKYIVVYNSTFEQDFEFCRSIEGIKQYIEDTFISIEELHKVRIFKLNNEIDVKDLGINITEIRGDIFSEVHKTTGTLQNELEQHDEKRDIELAAKKLMEGKNFVKEAYDLNDAQIKKIIKEVRIESAKGLIEYGSDDVQISRISKLTVEEVKKLRKRLEKNLELFEKRCEEHLNQPIDEVKKTLNSLENNVKRRSRGIKGGEILSAEEIDRRYGYTKEHQALDELYYDTSLTKEERLELFQKISPQTLEKISDKDFAEFGLKREELKKKIESGQWIKVNNEEELFDLFLQDKEKNDLNFKDEKPNGREMFQLVKKIVEEEVEDDKISKKYQDRPKLADSEWNELPLEKSSIDYYKNKKKEEKE